MPPRGSVSRMPQERWRTAGAGLLAQVLVGLVLLAPTVSGLHPAAVGLPALVALGVVLLGLGWRSATPDLEVARRGVPARSRAGSSVPVPRQGDPDAAGRVRPRAPGRGPGPAGPSQ